MTCCDFPLPTVRLSVSGDVFWAQSLDGSVPSWRIRAEAESWTAARTTIVIGKELIADVTIHAPEGSSLPEEVQAVAAALLWSALRARKLVVKP